MEPGKRTPFQILGDLEVALQGAADVDPWDPICELVEDVLDSVRLALTVAGVDPSVVDGAVTVARDYFTNHYV